MKHIYILCQNGVASGYGVGTYVKQLVLALKDEEIQLTVVMMLSDKKNIQIEYLNMVRYINIPQISDASLSEEEKMYSKKMIVYLLASYIDKKEENIFLFNYLEKVEVVELLSNYWNESKMIYVVHFMDYDGRISPDELTFMKSMDHLVCLSKVTKQKLTVEHDIPEGKVSVIYNGMKDCYQSTAEEERLAIRQKYFIRPEEKVLLFVGRVDLFKGLDILIEVMQLILQWDENIRLFVVGDGLLDLYLKKSFPVWSHISFTGKLPEKELRELYTISDLGVIPSLQEQCSFVGIEMMMFGLPIIVSNVVGVDEMFDDPSCIVNKIPVAIGENRNKCIQIWGNTIMGALKENDQLVEIRKSVRMLYENKFDIGCMKKKYLNLFEVK